MISIHVSVKTKSGDFIDQKAYKRAQVKAHDAMGKHWHTEQLSSHFKRNAAQQYQHAPRSKGYLKRKKIYAAKQVKLPQGGTVQRGGEVDNVYSGSMEKMLQRVGVIRAAQTKVSVNMQGPRYMTMQVFDGDRQRAIREGWKYGRGKSFSQRAGRQPDKLKEISTTTRNEREELAEIADKILEREAAGW